MRRLLVALLATGLTAFAPAAFAHLAAASTAPPYLSDAGTEFRVESNKEWSGATGITADMSNNPFNKPPGQWDPYTGVWAKKCSKKAQTATFQRSVTLPGTPTAASFSIAPVYPFSLANPFQSYQVKLNGAVVAKGKLLGPAYSGPTVTLSDQVRKSFQNGKNDLVVTVKRGKLPADRTCNTSETDAIGVAFRLFGDFAADLALVDNAPAPIFRKAGTSNSQIVNISLRNLGPSAAVAGGIFKVTIIGADVVLLGDQPEQIPGTYPTAPPFDHCTPTVVSATTEIRCVLSAMPTGTEAFISLGLLRTFTSTAFSDATTYLSWTVGHPEDPAYGNNTRSAQFTWCGTLSTKPECLALG